MGGNIWQGGFPHLSLPTTSSREKAMAVRWAFDGLSYEELHRFIDANPSLFARATVERFYGGDGHGGVYNRLAHQYLVAFMETFVAASPAQGQLRVAHVGCGIQRLKSVEKVSIVNFDVHDYGEPDVIVQSLDGNVPLGEGGFDAVLLAQASGALCHATDAARCFINGLAPGGFGRLRAAGAQVGVAAQRARTKSNARRCAWRLLSPAQEGVAHSPTSYTPPRPPPRAGLRRLTFSAEARMLQQAQDDGAMGSGLNGFKLLNNDCSVFGFGSASAGGNVRFAQYANP
jgi:hypothetical protein